MVPETGNTSATHVLMASAITYRFGFLDGRFVIPGAADGDFAHARGSRIGGGPGLVAATAAKA